MANDYPLEELSHRAFEQLSVALAMKVLGDGVEAFGSGPDGGREATFNGLVDWSQTAQHDDGAWNGYVVIQAKQAEHPSNDPGGNLKWLTRAIDAELDAWMDVASKRGRFPKYLIFVTNVRLSSVPGAGIDAVNHHIKRRLDSAWGNDGRNTLRRRGLEDWRVWHRDQLNGWLTKYDGIRHAFKGLLTVGDLMSRLGELSGLLDPDQFVPVLTAHSTRTLATERWVNFSEAGGSDRESVENVFVDLKATEASSDAGKEQSRVVSSVLEEVFRRSEMVLKPSLIRGAARQHLVITGQAGSGKSTVTKFLTQALRAAFASDEKLTQTENEVTAGTAAALDRMGIEGPRGRRWPMRVDLPEFADALGPDGGGDLLRWIADRVSARAGLNIMPNALKRWFTHWPCVIIFDGLDEVTAPEVRPWVLDQITQFVEDSERDDLDILVVVTTRPTGYTEQLMPTRFQQLDLQYLNAAEAIEYGRLVTMRRLSDDLDRRDHLIAAFEKQAKMPTMLRLMKTPLQVLIMTIILERAGVLPADRFQLFDRYFDTVYERESAKNTSLATLFTQQRGLITAVHEAAGLRLQVQSELSGDARALLPIAELRSLVVERLQHLEYESGIKLDRITDQVMQATTQRLVLLVPSEEDCVAFEIRSLQEMMAARAIANVPDELLRQQLVIAAPSPHWRNTWVFIAGAAFAGGADHRRELVVEVVESIDRSEDWAGWLCPVGPELAATLLDDGIAVAAPKWHRRLIDVALRAVEGPVPLGLQQIATGLAASAATDTSLHTLIRNRLKLALSGTPRAATAAMFLLAHGRLDNGLPQALIRAVESDGEENAAPKALGAVLRSGLANMPEPASAEFLLDRVLSAVEDVHIPAHGSREIGLTAGAVSHAWDGELIETINQRESAEALELLLGTLEPSEWRAEYGLAIVYGTGASRRPVGPALGS